MKDIELIEKWKPTCLLEPFHGEKELLVATSLEKCANYLMTLQQSNPDSYGPVYGMILPTIIRIYKNIDFEINVVDLYNRMVEECKNNYDIDNANLSDIDYECEFVEKFSEQYCREISNW